MKIIALKKISQGKLMLPSAAVLLAALAIVIIATGVWNRLRSKAPFLDKAQTAVLTQIVGVPLSNNTFTVRSYGGKCLEFGPPHPAPHQAILGNPLFISDCNGTAAQKVRVQEVNDRHEVILRMGNGVIGKNVIPVVILQTSATAQPGADSVEQASSAALGSTSTADQIPLEVQSYTGSEGQIFALDGDSVILAADRNLVIEVQNHRGANGTPLVLGHRDLDDSEFWTFTATDGAARKPTSGFVRISQTGNSADGELRARADFLNAVYGAKSGTVIELDPSVSLNLTYTPPLPIKAGVTIRGDRRGTHPGPELSTANQYATEGILNIDGDDVRITGLRLRGPSDSPDGDDRSAIGIVAHDDQFTRTIIDHNEMSAWTHAAVQVRGDDSSTECRDHRDPRTRPQNVLVARNFI